MTRTLQEEVEVERRLFSTDVGSVEAYFCGMVQTTVLNSGGAASARLAHSCLRAAVYRGPFAIRRPARLP